MQKIANIHPIVQITDASENLNIEMLHDGAHQS